MKHSVLVFVGVGLLACNSGTTGESNPTSQTLVSEEARAAMIDECVSEAGDDQNCECQVDAIQAGLGDAHFKVISDYVLAGDLDARDQYNRQLFETKPDLVESVFDGTRACLPESSNPAD